MTGIVTWAADTSLPVDWRGGVFVGRIDRGDGPCVVLIRDGALIDVTATMPTVAAFAEAGAPIDLSGDNLGQLDQISLSPEPDAAIRLLSPIDLQCVKASGVTFAVSAIERVIEERARGDAGQAAEVRARLEERVGGSIRSVVPGSAEATTLKAALIEDGMWSQYLEVAIGPDAEIFTKSPVLSTVGWGAAGRPPGTSRRIDSDGDGERRGARGARRGDNAAAGADPQHACGPPSGDFSRS